MKITDKNVNKLKMYMFENANNFNEILVIGTLIKLQV